MFEIVNAIKNDSESAFEQAFLACRNKVFLYFLKKPAGKKMHAISCKILSSACGNTASRSIPPIRSTSRSSTSPKRCTSISSASPAVQVVNQVMIGEDVAKGERILSFVVETKTAGRWKQEYAGTAAGNKHIATFAPVKASAMRLRVTQQRNKPAVIVFNAYFNEEIKPI